VFGGLKEACVCGWGKKEGAMRGGRDWFGIEIEKGYRDQRVEK